MSEIVEAFCAAQAEFKNPKFDSENPHFQSKFASLKSVLAAIRPVLSKHGLGFTQTVHGEGDERVLVTTLMHGESGEVLDLGKFPVRPARLDMNGYMAALTSARRASLVSICGVFGEDDDDGRIASGGKMNEEHATRIAKLVDAANLETGEGVDAFAEAWLELNSDEQLSFAPWVYTFWPGGVSAAKTKMKEIMMLWRQGQE